MKKTATCFVLFIIAADVGVRAAPFQRDSIGAEAGRRSAEGYFLLAYAHYRKALANGTPETADRDEAAKAINAYKTAFSLDPGLRTAAAPYSIHLGLGLCYEAVGANEAALDSYRQASLAAPNNHVLSLYAARLRHRMNDTAGSAADLALALRQARAANQDEALLRLVRTTPFFLTLLESDLNDAVLREYESLMPGPRPAYGAPRHAAGKTLKNRKSQKPLKNNAEFDVRGNLAWADAAFEARRFDEAIATYEETIRFDRESAILNSMELSRAYERLGAAYNRLGLSDGAVKAFLSAVQLAPGNADAHYQLAVAYALSRKYSQALGALGKAFQAAKSQMQRRRLSILARTDLELLPVRDLPAFRRLLRL